MLPESLSELSRLDADDRPPADYPATDRPSVDRAPDGRLSARIAPAQDAGPDFSRAVPPGGYAWWYLDGVSDDRRSCVTVIAFVGSVFSPYYALSGRKDPENHCAMNVALYGRPRRWTMTERGKARLSRTRHDLRIGASAMTWRNGELIVEVNERSAPFFLPVRGRIRLTPEHMNERAFPLDAAGDHVWRPIVLSGRVVVEMDNPKLSWEGVGYFDSNRGPEPLPRAFKRWDWMRGVADDGSVAIVYDVTARQGRGDDRLLALKAEPGRPLAEQDAPTRASLGRGPIWRVERAIRTDRGVRPERDVSLEDTPFYTRNEVVAPLFGRETTLIHESMDLDRLDSAWTPLLLPFRMPRIP